MTAEGPLVRDAKISDLLLKGNSVDVLTEQGVHRGWTRTDVLRVASENGWTLDPSGRIPRDQRRPPLASVPKPAAPAPTDLAAVQAPLPPLMATLRDGRTHPDKAIQRRADRIHEQLQQLAKDIEAAAEKKKALERIAQLERELAAAKAAAKGTTASTPMADRRERQAIRAWAKAQGLPVPERGRLPRAITEKWQAANSGGGDAA